LSQHLRRIEMSLRKFAISSRASVFCFALVLILAVGALATGIGIYFQGFEIDTSGWFNAASAQEIFREPSYYSDDGGYASGIASATGNYHARLVVDPTQCLDDDNNPGAPPNNDCDGPATNWNGIYVNDGATTYQSNIVTSATANFTAADVGLGFVAFDSNNNSIFAAGTTITSVTNSTTAVVSTTASENSTGALFEIVPVFTLGYVTEAAIYLDVSWAAGNPDWRFDWDSAIGNNAFNSSTFAGFLSDYVFNVGTQVAGDLTPGFWVGTSPNSGRENSYPENPCPGPSSGFGNYCRAPVKITTSGWYTFRHIFKIDPNTQNLSIEFQVVPLGGGTPLVDTTIYGWQTDQQAPPGGIVPLYGWFPNQEIPELAIDNTLLKDFDTLTLSPANPPPLGVGTIQTFILSASLFGTPDPLTPGLTPANVNFTQGGTGSVTVVPSGTQPNNGTFSFDATGGTVGSVNLTANIDIFPSNTASFNVIQPALYSPVNGSTLPGASVTFQWTEYPGASNYWLDVGSTPGGNNYAQSGALGGSTLSYTVNDLPTNGSMVYATWYYYVSGSWQHSQYSYTASGGANSKGVLTSPTPGSFLSGTTVTFIWTPGNGATAYWLDIGSTSGGNNYYQSGNLGNVTQVTVNGLPSNGSTLYVTLWSYINGQWVYNEYTYVAYGALGVLYSPPPNSTLPGGTVTFMWHAGTSATAYWLDIGSTAGGNNYYQSGNLGNVTQVTVNGLPTNGSMVYATLWSYVAGQWYYYEYTYTAFGVGSGSLGVMQTPLPGSPIGGNTATFTWSAGNGATAYWLDIGSSAGANDIYQSGNLGNVLTTTVNTLPANTTTIYATLYSYVGEQWYYNQYTYLSTVAFQGFETGTGDWNPTLDSENNPVTTTYQTPSGGGILQLTAFAGNYYAEVHNIDNDYISGYYGDSGLTFFGYGPGGGYAPPTPPPYPGDFSQSIAMYINANWPLALYGGPGVWIDESPGNFINGNYGGEHNFRITPSGAGSVAISADGGGTFATITTSGWYNFQMTFQKGAQPTDLVTTVMTVFDSNGNPVGATTVYSNSPGGPLYSQDLAGPGYLWITVWPNGWAGDVLGIDNVRVDLLH
jgi:hypothetical protein